MILKESGSKEDNQKIQTVEPVVVLNQAFHFGPDGIPQVDGESEIETGKVTSITRRKIKQ